MDFNQSLLNNSALVEAGYTPFLARLLEARGINTPEKALAFLNPEYYQASPPEEFPSMQLAVDRILQSIAKNEMLGIWGDFDVDGQTATAILYEGLKSLGARIKYHLPVRAIESHGVAIHTLEKFLPGVQLLITCDTGITANEAIDFALERGVPTIITDHHLPNNNLPNALCILNPHFLPENHPMENLSGAGVAYKLVEALLVKVGRFSEVQKYLDLAALGLIADLVPLTNENRYIAQMGLIKIREQKRPGLTAIMKNAGILMDGVDEETIGFAVAPRLNAAGRLADANFTVELLTTQDEEEAEILAQKLDEMNEQRKLLCDQVFNAARADIEKNKLNQENSILITMHPLWTPGVLGIVASRLVELYQKPVLVISNPPGEEARGSARSIPGVNITALLEQNREYLINFGGHPMAAGFSLDPKNLSAFSESIKKTFCFDATEKAIQTISPDAELRLSDIQPEFVEDIEKLAPFGVSNPSPLFVCKQVEITGSRMIGKSSEHLIHTVNTPQGSSHIVLHWQGVGQQIPEKPFDLIYRLRSRSFQGKKEIQIEWVSARQEDDEPVILTKEKIRKNLVHDYRKVDNPLKTLKDLYIQEKFNIWCEAKLDMDFPLFSRYQIKPCQKLAIFLLPPSRETLEQVLSRAKPQQVFLFAPDMKEETPKSFLSKLAGFVRYSIHHTHGITTLADLTRACSLTEAVVEEGLKWLKASGQLNFWFEETKLVLEYTNHPPTAELNGIEEKITKLLIEINAFRKFYLSAKEENLIS